MFFVVFFAKYDTCMYLQIMFKNNKYLQKESITNCAVHAQFLHCKQKQFVLHTVMHANKKIVFFKYLF